jgi:starvation-inducible outer membrane lipoprotein
MKNRRSLRVLSVVLASAALVFSGCATTPGKLSARKGDEIIVAGQLFRRTAS